MKWPDNARLMRNFMHFDSNISLDYIPQFLWPIIRLKSFAMTGIHLAMRGIIHVRSLMILIGASGG